MIFSELNLAPPILKAINECGYTTPTPIQERTIPEALAGRDLMASAQTGTGKTAAFMLPALHALSSFKNGARGTPRVLVLTPTRELASQVLNATRTYGKYIRFKSATLLGGMPYRQQLQSLSQPLELVVATPGRLIDHMERRSIDLSKLEILVLDEADRMLDMGFQEDMRRITRAAPSNRQTLLFSATMDHKMADLAKHMLRNPVRIDVAGKKNTGDNIEQRLHVTDNLKHKHRILQHLLNCQSLTQAIIFSSTKRAADTLANDLAARGHKAAALHGDMDQRARNRTVQDLRNGRIKLLVATDVAARGLDVNGISHVINFDLPKFAEDYVHRIGRTGRAGASGTAISFVSGADLGALQRIQSYIGKDLPQHVIEGLEPTQPLRSRPAGDNRRPGGQFRQPRPAGKPDWKRGGYSRGPGSDGGPRKTEGRRLNSRRKPTATSARY